MPIIYNNLTCAKLDISILLPHSSINSAPKSMPATADIKKRTVSLTLSVSRTASSLSKGGTTSENFCLNLGKLKKTFKTHAFIVTIKTVP